MKKTMRRGGSPPPQATDPWKNAKSAAYTPGGRRVRLSASQAHVDEVRKANERLRAGSYSRRVRGPTVEGEADMLARRLQAHKQNQVVQAEQRAAQAASLADMAAAVVDIPESDSVQAVLAPPVVDSPESSQARNPWVGEALDDLQRQIDALSH